MSVELAEQDVIFAKMIITMGIILVYILDTANRLTDPPTNRLMIQLIPIQKQNSTYFAKTSIKLRLSLYNKLDNGYFCNTKNNSQINT